MLIIYGAICVGWILLNVRAISVIVTMPRSQCRPSTWLVAHMAVIAIMANYLSIIFMIDKFYSFSIQRYRGVCQTFTFISGRFTLLIINNIGGIQKLFGKELKNDTFKLVLRFDRSLSFIEHDGF